MLFEAALDIPADSLMRLQLKYNMQQAAANPSFMERLHVDYIDLINVHDIEFADLNQVVNETLPALVELSS